MSAFSVWPAKNANQGRGLICEALIKCLKTRNPYFCEFFLLF